MNDLGHLETLLLNGEITEEEYKRKKVVYIETILELFVKGFIDEEEMKARLNE